MSSSPLSLWWNVQWHPMTWSTQINTCHFQAFRAICETIKGCLAVLSNIAKRFCSSKVHLKTNKNMIWNISQYPWSRTWVSGFPLAGSIRRYITHIDICTYIFFIYQYIIICKKTCTTSQWGPLGSWDGRHTARDVSFSEMIGTQFQCSFTAHTWKEKGLSLI